VENYVYLFIYLCKQHTHKIEVKPLKLHRLMVCRTFCQSFWGLKV